MKPHTCLFEALRNRGVNVRPDRDGPFWALADGNEALIPRGFKLVPCDGKAIHEAGKYVKWESCGTGHFEAIISRGSNGIETINGQPTEIDGCRLAELATDPDVVYYKLIATCPSGYWDHPNTITECDRQGGWRPPYGPVLHLIATTLAITSDSVGNTQSHQSIHDEDFAMLVCCTRFE